MALHKHILLALLATALGAATARAQPRPAPADASVDAAAAKERARALLAQGNQRLDAGLYLEALDLFQQAFATYPSPKLHFNIAQTYHELGRPLEALRHYERFLQGVREADMPDAWRLANERLFEIQGSIATVTVQCSVARASVSADGVVVGTTPLAEPLRFLPGAHVVIVGKPGYEQNVIELSLRAGDARTERTRLVTSAEALAERKEFRAAEAERRAAEERLRRTQREVGERRRRTQRALRTSGWIALGVGGVGVVAAGAAGGLSWYEASQIEGASRDSTWIDDGRPHDDRAATYRAVAYTGAAVGLVGVAVAGGLLWYGRADERPAIVPTAGPSQAGVALVGAF